MRRFTANNVFSILLFPRVSLNLRNNPLMESLGKLANGRGREVVRRIIPQLRMLDCAHLSIENSAVNAGTLDDANDIVCEGATRARAAWAEEDPSSDGGNWGESGGEEASRGSLSRGASLGETKADEGVPTSRGIVHWDSDLTQGGAQVFSGNPRYDYHVTLKVWAVGNKCCRITSFSAHSRVLNKQQFRCTTPLECHVIHSPRNSTKQHDTS